HRWPWLPDDQFPAHICADFFATFVHHCSIDAKERQRRAPGFGRNCAWQWRDHDCACLSLPPGIDDRTAPAPDRLVIPHPSLGIDRLADRSKETQGRKVMFLHPVIAPANERTNRSRRGI